ncbi:MAG: archaemetzincin family Zn-dependent metalloprotease [Bacteroidota bacterium]
MDTPTITMISFGRFGNGFLEKISESVRHEFNCPVFIKEAHIDVSEFYDPGRRQYNGDKLLREVDSLSTPFPAKTIGLFNVDLYIPILTYIFGQAQFGGRTGVASLYRLNNESYGMPKDDISQFERFKKEIIHELGHTFGLVHCHTPNCVMRSSTYVEDIDQKEAQLCSKCRMEIGLE